MTTNSERNTGVALVTGASGGIGEGFARRLARDGHGLVLVARRKDRLDRLAAQLVAERGIAVDVIQADLARDGGVDLVEARLRKGDVELLVNNAGFGTFGEFADLPLDHEVEELDLNVRALVRLTHAALGPMIERRRGAIINVASMAGFQPLPYQAVYAASKAFVLHFSEAVHEEARQRGVTVTCLCPGPVRTEFQQVAGVDPDRVPAAAWMTVDSVVEAALSGVRAGRAIVIPGALNAMMAASTRMAPRFVVRRVAGSMMRDQGRRASG